MENGIIIPLEDFSPEIAKFTQIYAETFKFVSTYNEASSEVLTFVNNLNCDR